MTGPVGACRRERGSMAVEVVLMIPVLVAFLLLVVAGGRLVWTRGEVEAASRDAVRAASLERSRSDAYAAVRTVAGAQLGDRAGCRPPDLTWAPAGGVITVTLSCDVSFDGLGLIGLPGSTTVESTSAAPLDVFRRSDP